MSTTLDKSCEIQQSTRDDCVLVIMASMLRLSGVQQPLKRLGLAMPTNPGGRIFAEIRQAVVALKHQVPWEVYDNIMRLQKTDYHQERTNPARRGLYVYSHLAPVSGVHL